MAMLTFDSLILDLLGTKRASFHDSIASTKFYVVKYNAELSGTPDLGGNDEH
jgi:hypothetical protein